MFCASACSRLLCWEHLSRSSLPRLQTLSRLPPPSSLSSVSIQLAAGIRDQQTARNASLYLRVGSCPSLSTTCPFSSTTSSSLEASSLLPLGSDLSAVPFSFHVKNNSSFCILVHSGQASQVGTLVKNPPANTRDTGRHRFYPWV